nr:36.4 kDa proline-rich protein-like [Pelodiscus sinensis]|eukprot:XP_014434873.2 36.4 kDa proline-rich protein-like [Pelodiscus sinensis]
MALFFTEEPAPARGPLADSSTVEALAESFYFHLLKLMPGSAAPPPRPPKRRDVKGNAGPQLPSATKSPAKPKPLPHLSTSPHAREAPELPCSKPRHEQRPLAVHSTPNEYAPHQTGLQRTPPPTKPFKEARDANASDDSDHDYELVEDDFIQTVHKMKQFVFH